MDSIRHIYHIICNKNNENKNIIYVYLSYGIYEEHRFYPNMLTSFIPKLFVKNIIYQNINYSKISKIIHIKMVGV